MSHRYPIQRYKGYQQSARGRRTTPLALQDMALWLNIQWPGQWEAEFRFHPVRRWRFDFACPSRMLAVEVEGLLHGNGGGRHQRPGGYEKDCEKYNEALLNGWTVLRVTYATMRSGAAHAWIERAMGETNESGRVAKEGRGKAGGTAKDTD